MNKDPYNTYTDYWPVKRSSRKVSWFLILLILATILALAGAVYFGAKLLVLLQGAL